MARIEELDEAVVFAMKDKFAPLIDGHRRIDVFAAMTLCIEELILAQQNRQDLTGDSKFAMDLFTDLSRVITETVMKHIDRHVSERN